MKIVRAAVPVQTALPECEHQSADILQNLRSETIFRLQLDVLSFPDERLA